MADAPKPFEPLASDAVVSHGRLGAEADAPSRRWVGPAVAAGLAMGAATIAGLVLTGMQDKAIYSKPVDSSLHSVPSSLADQCVPRETSCTDHS
jgi:hypothetical protein